MISSRSVRSPTRVSTQPANCSCSAARICFGIDSYAAVQDVAEPETVLADEAPPVGTDQLLADERLQKPEDLTDLLGQGGSATAPQRNT